MPHPTFGEEDKIHGVPPAAPKTFSEKAKNFWYHYKWHSIFAAFALVVILILSLQMCTRTTYDIYVLYAGDKAFLPQSTKTGILEMQSFSPDVNGDGNVNVAYKPYYIVDPNKMQASGAPDAGDRVATSQEEYEQLQNEILTGTYKIYLLSPDMYEELEEEGLFLILPDYLTGLNTEALTPSKTGVLLSSLAVNATPAFQNLPGETILAIRRPSVVNQDKAEKSVEDHIKAVQAWIDYIPEE